MNADSVGISTHVFHDLAIRHQIHHDLRRIIYCGAEAPDNVLVLQLHPHGDLLAERLVGVDYVNGPRRKEGELPTFSIALRPPSPSLTATLITLIHTLALAFEFFSLNSPFHTLA